MIECRAERPMRRHTVIACVVVRTFITDDHKVVVRGDVISVSPKVAADLVSSGRARLVDWADLAFVVDAQRTRDEQARLPAHLRGRFVQTR